MSWLEFFSTFREILKDAGRSIRQLIKLSIDSKAPTDVQDFWTNLLTAVSFLDLHASELRIHGPTAELLLNEVLQSLEETFIFADPLATPEQFKNHVYARYTHLHELHESQTSCIIAVQPICIGDAVAMNRINDMIRSWKSLLSELGTSSDTDINEYGTSVPTRQFPLRVGHTAGNLFDCFASEPSSSCPHQPCHQVCIVLSSYSHLEHDEGNRYLDLAFAVDEDKLLWQEVRVHLEQPRSQANEEPPSTTSTSSSVRFQSTPHEEPSSSDKWQTNSPRLVRPLCNAFRMKAEARLKRQNWLCRHPDGFYTCNRTEKQFLSSSDFSLVDFHSQLHSGIGYFSKQLLAVLLSYSLLHLSFSGWLPVCWPQQRIRFFRCGSSTFLRPLLLVTGSLMVQKPEDSSAPIHNLPLLPGFAGMLIELYENRTIFEILSIPPEDTDDPDGQLWLTQEAYDRCKKNMPNERRRYKSVIESCLHPTFELDNFDDCSEDDLREHIFHKIVLPLETELLLSFGEYEPMADLDADAAILDIQNGEFVDEKTTKKGPASHMARSEPYVPQATSTKVKAVTNGRIMDISTGAAGPSETAAVDKWIAKIHKIRGVHHLIAPGSRRLRIVILDTGIDRTHAFVRDQARRIKVSSWTENPKVEKSNDRTGDKIGHGTFVASLILQMVPTADIFVAKITDTETLGDANVDMVAAALEKARGPEWRADVIDMSFGFQQAPPAVEKQIKACLKQDILLFAAASNNGGNAPPTYPGTREGVFDIYSTNHDGRGSSFNPPPRDQADNFCTLGEAVKSAWPAALNKTPEDGFESRMNGTSVAAPVAIGIAALFMEWCWKNINANDVIYESNTPEGMRSLFRKLKINKEEKFSYLNPDAFFLMKEREDILREIKGALNIVS